LKALSPDAKKKHTSKAPEDSTSRGVSTYIVAAVHAALKHRTSTSNMVILDLREGNRTSALGFPQKFLSPSSSGSTPNRRAPQSLVASTSVKDRPVLPQSLCCRTAPPWTQRLLNYLCRTTKSRLRRCASKNLASV